MEETNITNSCIESVTVFFNGGLGNQIFQYMAGQHLIRNIGIKNIKFINKNNQLKTLSIEKLINIPQVQSSNEFVSKNKYYSFFKKISNKSISYFESLDLLTQYKLGKLVFSRTILLKENIPFSKKIHNIGTATLHCKNLANKAINANLSIKLDGFWQDPSPYLIDINSISKSFHMKLRNLNKVSKLEPGTYISIHARRGDYINNLQNAKEYYSTYCFVNYLMSCINLLPSEYDDCPIVLISDDLEWFRNLNLEGISIKKRKIIFLDGNEIDHWIILNNSKLNIISNSTFSLTAALLNNSNLESKLRIIMPFWYSKNITTRDKGWQNIKGSIAL